MGLNLSPHSLSQCVSIYFIFFKALFVIFAFVGEIQSGYL